jgi:hypothetical protein
MRPQCLFLIATILAPHERGAAQRPGQRVRLTIGAPSPRLLVGTFVAQDAESVWVELPGHPQPVAVARTAAARLEVSGGVRRRTIAGAQIGAGLGAIGGFALGSVAAGQSEVCYGFFEKTACVPDFGRAFQSSLIGVAVGGAIGAALGALVRTERWSPVPLGCVQHITVAPFGAGVALSFAF